MELKRIGYSSAVFVGVIVLIFGLVSGIISWYMSNNLPVQVLEQFGISPGSEFLQTGIVVPIIQAIFFGYLTVLLMIYIYNTVAKKYPIHWELNHK